MNKAVTTVLVVLGCAAGLFAWDQHRRFKAAKAVVVANTVDERGLFPGISLRNPLSRQATFRLTCHKFLKEDSPKDFTEVVILAPRTSREYNLMPKTPSNTAGYIPDRSCFATWQGPFGMTRFAFGVMWSYGKSAAKISFD